MLAAVQMVRLGTASAGEYVTRLSPAETNRRSEHEHHITVQRRPKAEAPTAASPCRGAKPWGRTFWSRFIGIVVYAGLVTWSWWFMPSAFLFVLPGAMVAAYLQTVARGR